MIRKIINPFIDNILLMLTFYSMLFALVSCDDYVDITPKGAVTVDSAYTYYELVVNPMMSYYPSSFAYLSDDLWAKESFIIGSESTTSDGINFTFNESADRTLLSDNNLYENMYSSILRSNLIIDNIDAAPGTDDIKVLAKAEARTYRAFNLFLAVNTFAKAYNPETAASDGGICIVKHYDLEATPRKSTVADVYDFIITELEEAVPELQETPLNIYHPSRAFGWALLSEVYLFHRDWTLAQEAALNSLSLNNNLIDYNVINDNGGIARYRVYNNENNPEVLSYQWMASGWTTEGVTLYRYGMISPELVNLFEDNDLRYSLFFRQTGTTISTWFDVGSGAAIWTPANTSARFTYITVGKKTSEVYLILAEAYARQNNLPKAAEYVNTVREHRMTAGDNVDIAVPSSEQEMMNIIITERRKELLFGFHRFFDLKRLNTETEYAKTITRTFPILTTTVAQQTYTLLPDSRLYIIPFPHSARDKNPYLTLNTDE